MASLSMSSSKQRLASDEWISSRARRNSGWNEYSAICKLYWHFLRKHINFVELVTVMRIHASPLALSGVGTRGFLERATRSFVGRRQADWPKTRAAKPYNRNRKPRMKSLWHPGYK